MTTIERYNLETNAIEEQVLAYNAHSVAFDFLHDKLWLNAARAWQQRAERHSKLAIKHLTELIDG
jgi:uncharacterized membrane protein